MDNHAARPDSSVIKLIEIFHDHKFTLRTVDDKWHEGYLAVVPGGINVYEKEFRRLKESNRVEILTVGWDELAEVRIKELKGGSFNRGIAVGSAVGVVFWLLMIFGLSGT